MKKMLAALVSILLLAAVPAVSQASIGDKAPDFTIQLADGKKTTLSSLKGQAVLVHFWATWCPPCVRELPGMNKLAVKLASQKNPKLVFIGICVSDTEKNRDSFMKKNNYTFPCGLDENGDIAAQKYGVEGIPTSVLVSPQGKILKENVGMMTENELAEFVKGYAE